MQTSMHRYFWGVIVIVTWGYVVAPGCRLKLCYVTVDINITTLVRRIFGSNLKSVPEPVFCDMWLQIISKYYKSLCAGPGLKSVHVGGKIRNSVDCPHVALLMITGSSMVWSHQTLFMFLCVTSGRQRVNFSLQTLIAPLSKMCKWSWRTLM